MVYKMTLADILDLRCFDYRGKIKDILLRVDVRDLPNNDRYSRIRAEMKAEGVNRVPVYISNGTMVGDGLHRIRLAVEAGLTELLVSDDLEECRQFGPVM